MNIVREMAFVLSFLPPQWYAVRLSSLTIHSLRTVVDTGWPSCLLIHSWDVESLISTSNSCGSSQAPSEKYHFFGLPLSKPKDSQSKKWRTFDPLHIHAFLFSKPTQDLEIWVIFTFESPNSKVVFSLIWFLLIFLHGLCHGKSRASFALSSSMPWTLTALIILEIQTFYWILLLFVGTNNEQKWVFKQPREGTTTRKDDRLNQSHKGDYSPVFIPSR